MLTNRLEPATLVSTRPDWLVLSSSQQTLLKVLAILLMLLDHTNRLLLGGQPWLYALGRVSFPLFAFLIAYNVAVRGVAPRRYALPLLLFGVISQGPAMLALARDPFPLNIFFTLLLGVIFLPLRRRCASFLPPNRFGRSLSWTLTTVLFALLSLPLEYGPPGVFLIPALVAFLRRPSEAVGVLVLSLMFVMNGLTWAAMAGWLAVPVIVWARSLALPSLPRLKWVFYGFYPLHLLGLWGLERVL